jgi:peptide/nickel transport system permease protein
VRIRVLITDFTPEDTPTFIIYLDDCTFEIIGNYHGLLGAGESGEDIWSQLLWGAQNAFRVAIIAALIATIGGLIVGLIAGYYGGIIDDLLLRLTDFFMIIPGLALMIVLAAIIQPRWWNIVWIIALIGWTSTARIVRSKVIEERQRAYVDAAKAIGGNDYYIITRHVLPVVIPLLLSQFILAAAGALLAEAGLAFLGLTSPIDVSWGRMLWQAFQSGASTIGAWWYVLFPGLSILLLALAFTLVGYAINEILNPPIGV